jgi:hypothetical protein
MTQASFSTSTIGFSRHAERAIMRLPCDAALIVIDVQHAIDDACWGPRNNLGESPRSRLRRRRARTKRASSCVRLQTH